MFEDNPPRSKRGELYPAYSQSITQRRDPSSKKFAGNKSLCPKTISYGAEFFSSNSDFEIKSDNIFECELLLSYKNLT
ncbi:MAG: hypothetical protein Ct9H300mP18_06760 [Candidatus Neomarinimicrobiota bacterium]|nr:MAG: hypothetical protein Ct9H300mP18_06760 [Candidatus Neomarinimicrobiota bacterium]